MPVVLSEQTNPGIQNTSNQQTEPPGHKESTDGPSQPQQPEGDAPEELIVDESHVTPPRQRPYQCTLCSKRFSSTSGLRQHQNIHSSVKPYTCGGCRKAYTQFSNLCRHKRLHPECREPAEPFNQNYCQCGRGFESKALLQRHQNVCKDLPNGNVMPVLPLPNGTGLPPLPMPFSFFPPVYPFPMMPMFPMNQSPNTSSGSEVEETEARPIDRSPRFNVGRVRPAVPIVKPIKCGPKFLNFPPKQEFPFDLTMGRAHNAHGMNIQSVDDQPLDLSVKGNEMREKMNEKDVDSPNTPEIKKSPCLKTTPSEVKSENYEEVRQRHLQAMQQMIQNQFTPQKSGLYNGVSDHLPGSMTIDNGGATNGNSIQFDPQMVGNFQENGEKMKKFFPCTFCGKLFPRGANLNRHMRIHTGEKPYECNLCHRHFSISSNLKRHIQNVHDENRLQCNLCDKTFPHESRLAQHISAKHGIHSDIENHLLVEKDKKINGDVIDEAELQEEDRRDENQDGRQITTEEYAETQNGEQEIPETHITDVQNERIVDKNEASDDNNNDKNTNDNHKINIRDIYPNFPESDDEE